MTLRFSELSSTSVLGMYEGEHAPSATAPARGDAPHGADTGPASSAARTSSRSASPAATSAIAAASASSAPCVPLPTANEGPVRWKATPHSPQMAFGDVYGKRRG